MPVALVFGSDAIPSGQIVTRGVRGKEQVSGLFEVAAYVQPATDGDLLEDGAADLFAKPCWIAVDGADVLVRGMVRDVQLEDVSSTDPPFYRITVVPRLWRATMTRRCRIFQDLSVPAIVRSVLEALGFAPTDSDFRLGGAYPKREYVVQYEETDYDFLCRLCEDEGIFFWFDHGGDVDLVVFADGNGSSRAGTDHQSVAFQVGVTTRQTVSELTRTVQCVQSSVQLLDYNWRTPKIALDATAKVDQGTTGTLVDTRTPYHDMTAGNRLVKIRAQEIASTHAVYRGTSDVVTLRAGDQMGVTGFPVASLDQTYFVTQVAYEFERQGQHGTTQGAAYANTFTAIPLTVPFRAPRVAPRPVVAGFVYATIDGPNTGAAAPIDDQGRYKVVLPFDTTLQGTGTATRWIRMMQPLAGASYGVHFPLRVGTEVALTHVNGDPDRPVIAGAIPNALTPSPVSKANSTQSVMQTHTGVRIEIEENAT
ncbi:MAG TPA: type VI secretion system tip protein TssI/VgrG [Polyangiaceae bacterium]|jgi:type VI secretion system VgrG family protein